MAASVPLLNGLDCGVGELPAGRIISQQMGDFCFHCASVGNADEIFIRLEKVLVILPRRADDRNTACECLEKANRWYPSQTVGVKAAGNMKRESALGIYVGRRKIWKIAAILNSGGVQLRLCLLR